MALALLESLVALLIAAASLFAAAGSLRWPMAWTFLLLSAAGMALGFFAVDRALLVERSHLLAGDEKADVLLSVSFALLLYPGTLVACGLDRRFGASPPLPLVLQLSALGIFAAGYAFGYQAMRANPFFSAAVRIQSERGHHLVDRGPYRFVRHPGYAGALLAHLALPIALGSFWGLAPALLGALLLALRIPLEERTLRGGLSGYEEYTRRVRWRLVPGVW
jgi:protein-S-isoprenylcysteine O-methyltransferase Ste14